MVARNGSGGLPFLLNFVYLVDASRSGGCERAVSDFWAWEYLAKLYRYRQSALSQTRGRKTSREPQLWLRSRSRISRAALDPWTNQPSLKSLSQTHSHAGGPSAFVEMSWKVLVPTNGTGSSRLSNPPHFSESTPQTARLKDLNCFSGFTSVPEPSQCTESIPLFKSTSVTPLHSATPDPTFTSHYALPAAVPTPAGPQISHRQN